jgi:hypothetical protein
MASIIKAPNRTGNKSSVFEAQNVIISPDFMPICCMHFATFTDRCSKVSPVSSVPVSAFDFNV